jgi:ABC-type phosphate/phosphonate transport system substrate-binding protein
VVVRKDSLIAKAADLKGKKLALAHRTREHCRLFIERRCCPSGTETKGFFSQIIAPADQEEALDSVVNGNSEATVVDGEALENYAERKPGCFAKLKTLLQSEPFPWAVIACDPAHLDEATQKRLCQGMIKATETRKGKQLLTICRIAGFELVPKDYERDLLQIVKAYPPPSTDK